MDSAPSFSQRRRITYVAEALVRKLDEQPKPVLSNYELYRLLWGVYVDGKAKYIRGDKPTHDMFVRTRASLVGEAVIRSDADYTPLWRVVSKADEAAEDIACSVDPFCYISHMSAMQRYGLTNRRPEALYLTEPPAVTKRQLLKQAILTDYGEDLNVIGTDFEAPAAVLHPPVVRGRPLQVQSTKHVGDHVAIKGSFSRISTIGQTFLDMLDEPARCGGMAHILDIWSEHARTYLEEILLRVEATAKPILKVRAGYIIDEYLGISDARVIAWLRFAQRGSSRVLAAGEPFAPRFSEKWMLSLNV